MRDVILRFSLVATSIFLWSGCAPQKAPPSPYLTAMAPSDERVSRPIPPTRKPSPKPVATKGVTVFLDPGHGGKEFGAVYRPRRLQEKRLTLDIAKRVERLLAEKGYSVRLSRTKDVTVSLEKRVQLAEQVSASVFVSIHFNSSPTKNTSGAEVFYRGPALKRAKKAMASKKLAASILNALCRTLPTGSRGVKDGDFHVIRETSMPSVLVEAAFMTNPQDAVLLSKMAYRQKIAQAIARGVDEYFSMSKK